MSTSLYHERYKCICIALLTVIVKIHAGVPVWGRPIDCTRKSRLRSRCRRAPGPDRFQNTHPDFREAQGLRIRLQRVRNHPQPCPTKRPVCLWRRSTPETVFLLPALRPRVRVRIEFPQDRGAFQEQVNAARLRGFKGSGRRARIGELVRVVPQHFQNSRAIAYLG